MAYETVNPASGELIATYPMCKDDIIEEALRSASDSFLNRWSRLPVEKRCQVLSRAADLLRERSDEHAKNITLEVGKLYSMALAEIQLSASILDYYATNAAEFIKPKSFAGFPRSQLHVKALGPILAIEPWNFPYYQVARVVGPQLAVGNVLLVKHAENVPRCALALEALLLEAGAPEGVYTNVFASIDQVGRMIDDPRVVGVTLTGSEKAGISVAERAGRNLKKAVLELGGNDPLIVLEDAPLQSAIQGAIAGRMFNNGQSCVASKRFIVVGKKRGGDFLEGVINELAQLQAGELNDPTTTLSPVASERALKLLLNQIQLAKEHGATVALGGERLDRPGFYLAPTVITDIDAANPIAKQEIFGPVASVYVVESVEEAIELANSTPFGLGGSVFSADIEKAQAVADQIDSGMVWINQPAWTTAELPFGGIKRSGIGRELSELGIHEFVNQRLYTSAPSGAPVWGPAS